MENQMMKALAVPQPGKDYDQPEKIPLRDLERFATWGRERTGVECSASNKEIARHARAVICGKANAPRSPKFEDSYEVIFHHVVMRAYDAARRVRGRRSVLLIPYGQFIVPHEPDACAAAVSIKNETMQFEDAPDLPLADCDQAYCKCMIRQLSKRRMIREGLMDAPAEEAAPRNRSWFARVLGRN